MDDAITAAIRRSTARIMAQRLRITAERFARQNRIIDERREMRTMALEIKGLKGKAMKAAANLDRLNQAYDKFNEAAPAHAADVEGLTPQIAALEEDLQFATQVLGNSVNGSGEQQKPPVAAPQVSTAPEHDPEHHTRISDGSVIER